MPERHPKMPEHVATIVACGFATWATDDIDPNLRAKFDAERIPVTGVRNVRVWGLQVDDERELPGRERTQIPDEELWEINLEALDIMIELNNRFALDGRDPNSYSGIFWVLGRHDRPWGPERPIFGTVRYMSSDNTARKFRVRGYIERFGGNGQ